MKVDVPWSLGFLVGAVVTGVIVNTLGLGGILRLILVVGGGVCGGMLGELLAKNMRSRPGG